MTEQFAQNSDGADQNDPWRYRIVSDSAEVKEAPVLLSEEVLGLQAGTGKKADETVHQADQPTETGVNLVEAQEAEDVSRDDDPTNQPEGPIESPRMKFRGRYRDVKMSEDGRTMWVEWQDGFRVAISASWLRLQMGRWIKR